MNDPAAYIVRMRVTDPNGVAIVKVVPVVARDEEEAVRLALACVGTSRAGRHIDIQSVAPDYLRRLHRRSPLKPNAQWVSHHGMRQRLRVMRQRLRRVIALDDEASVAARARCVARFAGVENEEFARHHVMLAAMEVAEANALPFADALTTMLDQLESEEVAAG